jgi:hypothetical protein
VYEDAVVEECPDGENFSGTDFVEKELVTNVLDALRLPGRPVFDLRENRQRRPLAWQASQRSLSVSFCLHRIFRSWHSSQACLNWLAFFITTSIVTTLQDNSMKPTFSDQSLSRF